MNNPKNEISKRVKEVESKAEKILNQGVVGKDSLKLQNTLEAHARIKFLLEELDYTLSKDIPSEDVLDKISSVEKELDNVFPKEK